MFAALRQPLARASAVKPLVRSFSAYSPIQSKSFYFNIDLTATFVVPDNRLCTRSPTLIFPTPLLVFSPGTLRLLLLYNATLAIITYTHAPTPLFVNRRCVSRKVA